MSEKMGTKNIRMTDEMISACEKYAAEYNAGNANAKSDRSHVVL